MTGFRKFIALLMMILIGIPMLFAVIWAVGMTQAVMSPEFITDLPREVINEVPDIMEAVFVAAKDDKADIDENSRAWLTAFGEVDVSIRDLMAETGVNDWLENQLGDSLDAVAAILQGRRAPENIKLNFRPLKEALNHPAIDTYMLKVLDRLPPCSPEQMEEWKNAAFHTRDIEGLPACKPDVESLSEAVSLVKQEIVSDMPDEVDMIEGAEHLPYGMDMARTAVSLSIIMFLFPALVILLASLIGATSKSGFFTWSGVSTMIGGLAALGLSFFVKNLLTGYMFTPEFVHMHHAEMTQVEELVFQKVTGLTTILGEYLFGPVVTVAGVVCIVGLILFAFSFAFTQTKPQASRPQTPGAGQQQTQVNQ